MNNGFLRGRVGAYLHLIGVLCLLSFSLASHSIEVSRCTEIVHQIDLPRRYEAEDFREQYSKVKIYVPRGGQAGVSVFKNKFNDSKVLKKTFKGTFSDFNYRRELDFYLRYGGIVDGIPKLKGWSEASSRWGGMVKEGPSLLLEYIDGPNLDTMMRGAGSDTRAVKSFLAPVLDAAKTLKQLHDVDIVHFDIKPSNIVVNPKGETHLIDFSGFIEDASTKKLDSIQVSTPDYLAPDAYEGEPVNKNFEVYSFGKIVKEILDIELVQKAAGLPDAFTIPQRRALQSLVHGAMHRKSKYRITLEEFINELEQIFEKHFGEP